MNKASETRPSKVIRTADEGYRALIAAILNSALSEADTDDAEVFAYGAWCEDLCEGIGLSRERYLKAFMRERRRRLRRRKEKEKKG